MHRSKIEWVRNPDASPGWVWNPITGCLNGCEYCYARKLANTRLKERYLANPNVAIPKHLEGMDLHSEDVQEQHNDPFYPRFWPERLEQINSQKPKGIFCCDMSDLFGIGIPEQWTKCVLSYIKSSPQHRFYLLTKQPQNLIKWSPFPENCWVGVTMTNGYDNQLVSFRQVKAKVKYISFEPLLKWSDWATSDMTKKSFKDAGIDWVIIGAQTKPYKPPKIEWIREIVEACDKAGIPVFLKNNLYPLIHTEMLVSDRKLFRSAHGLRQEMVKGGIAIG